LVDSFNNFHVQKLAKKLNADHLKFGCAFCKSGSLSSVSQSLLELCSPACGKAGNEAECTVYGWWVNGGPIF